MVESRVRALAIPSFGCCLRRYRGNALHRKHRSRFSYPFPSPSCPHPPAFAGPFRFCKARAGKVVSSAFGRLIALAYSTKFGRAVPLSGTTQELSTLSPTVTFRSRSSPNTLRSPHPFKCTLNAIPFRTPLHAAYYYPMDCAIALYTVRKPWRIVWRLRQIVIGLVMQSEDTGSFSGRRLSRLNFTRDNKYLYCWNVSI